MLQTTTSPSIIRCKCSIIGEATSGKSTMIQTLIANSPPSNLKNYTMTVDAEIFLKSVEVADEPDQMVEFSCFDIAGHSVYRDLLAQYAEGSQWCLYVMDLTNVGALDSLDRWIRLCRSVVQSPTRVILIGSKSDLVARRAVSREVILKYCKGSDLLYYEVSATSPSSILDVFREMAKQQAKGDKLK
eukprot:Partr_v1_DN24046_c1_g1_i1_m34767 putative Ras-related protein